MAQDELQSDRVERIAQPLSPHFDDTCMALARRSHKLKTGD